MPDERHGRAGGIIKSSAAAHVQAYRQNVLLSPIHWQCAYPGLARPHYPMARGPSRPSNGEREGPPGVPLVCVSADVFPSCIH